MTDPQIHIPMPLLISDARSAASDADPATSHEHGPIADRPVRDPSDAGIDDPVTVYARRLWTELDAIGQYLREGIARGGTEHSLLTTDDAWAQWQERYAAVLSILAGPAGDQGYGQQEAQLEHQNRAPDEPVNSPMDGLQP
jgi:hypothetical protein